MYLNEHLLTRLVEDRNRELVREANKFRLLNRDHEGWRARVARSLVALAERLEPGAGTTGRSIIRL
jgi:hypothetical protein